MKKYKVSEERVQIYLSKEQYEKGKALAKAQGLSFAGVVREALAEYGAAKKRLRKGVTPDDPINNIVGCLKGDSSADVATNHDQYLAEGMEKERRRWHESS